MSTNDAAGASPRDGAASLLDTDLYKLTMQCAVLKHFADTPVSYKFTNRTPHMKFSRTAFEWMNEQITKLATLRVTSDELVWLQKTCPYLSSDYIDFLRDFRLRPEEHIKTSFEPVNDSKSSEEELGDVVLSIKGLWEDTILYEIPLLALISETYFRFMDRDWKYDGQKESAKEKGLRLLEAGCAFSEFGSRRRRDYHTHELVMEGLLEASKEAASRGYPGKFTGTSNVHMAMRFGVVPIGTVAHEWFMGIAAIKNDYARANELALEYWVKTFGPGVLGIALTDTFGTPTFLRSFSQPAPVDPKGDSGTSSKAQTYAEVFTGVRQDSGDPLAFITNIKRFYHSQGIHAKKVVVFSDSLNVDRCIQYKTATESNSLTPSFGIGTFFTNDYRSLSTGDKSVPLNIVIKLSEAAGHPAVKLSDDIGKNMGEDSLIQRIKKEVGYTNRSWTGGDEAHRWDG